MSEVDDQLGVLFDWMRERGLLDDTLVVLTSDHGDQMGDHWLVEKLGWWDESYHVPLIVVDPRGEADATRGTTVERFTEHVDVLPTLCAWMGAPSPLQCDGRALQPFLHDDDDAVSSWRRAAHWEWDFRDPGGHAAEDLLGITMEECGLNVWRDERWKYVQFGAPAEVLPSLLFDLEADPDQTVNLAADPAHAAVVAQCATELLRWRMRHAERTLTGHLATPLGMQVREDVRSLR